MKETDTNVALDLDRSLYCAIIIELITVKGNHGGER
jgi:hypothetical protein